MVDFSIDAASLEKLGGIEFLSKQAVEGFITGLHKSPLHGFSVEFAEHRLYNQGESVRHIDWKLFARTDKLFQKKYEEETNLRCYFLLDHSSSMFYPEKTNQNKYNKFEFSAFCIASMMQLLKKQRDAFGLTVFSDTIEMMSEAKSSQIHQKYIYNQLEHFVHSQEKERKTSATEALHQIAEHIHKRSLVIIFSDMLENSNADLDEIFFGLQHLKHRKHEVILFHVMDQDKEVDFMFDDRPYMFVDVESGENIKLQPNQVKELYTKKTKEYFDEIKTRCLSYNIDFVEADIKNSYEDVLKAYLLKRERLY